MKTINEIQKMINHWQCQESGGVWDEAEVSNNNLDE